MVRRNNMVRFRFEFEEQPIIDSRQMIHGPEDLDTLFDQLKRKLYGRK